MASAAIVSNCCILSIKTDRKNMRFDLPRDDGYLTLGQFWEGNFTLKGVGTNSAREAAEKIALEHEGIEDTFHRNWVIPFRRGLALFERLDKLRAKRSQPDS